MEPSFLYLTPMEDAKYWLAFKQMDRKQIA